MYFPPPPPNNNGIAKNALTALSVLFEGNHATCPMHPHNTKQGILNAIITENIPFSIPSPKPIKLGTTKQRLKITKPTIPNQVVAFAIISTLAKNKPNHIPKTIIF